MESERQESNLRPHFCSALSRLSYIPYRLSRSDNVWAEFHDKRREKLRTCFLNWKPVSRINNNLLPEEYLPELPTCGIKPPTQVVRAGTPCFSWQIAGDGFEPPFSRIWVLWDSVSLSCLNPDSRVSKVIYRVMRSTRLFYAVPAPRSCFGYYYAFDFMFLENSLVINARLWWLIETKKHLSDGKSDQAQAYAVTYLCSFWFTYAHPKVFSAHKTDG